MKNFYKAFLGNKDGNISIIVGTALFVLVGMISVMMDLSVMQSQESKLQDSADSAALSGAILLAMERGDVESDAKKQALSFAKYVNDVTMDSYESDVIVDASRETVEVNLSVGVPQLFSSIMRKENLKVRVSAKAQVLNKRSGCIYTLDPAVSGSLSTEGTSSLVTNDCSIEVMSNSSTALVSTGVSTMVAPEFCVAGSARGRGFSTLPAEMCTPENDPFASLEIPNSGICSGANTEFKSRATMSPGTYCGGINLTSFADVTFEPGTYFIKDSTFLMAGSARARGNGVTFVLEGNSTISISGTTELILTPPDTGDLAGFNFVQSRDAEAGLGSAFAGTGQLSIGGVIYLPKQDLEVVGTADVSMETTNLSTIVTNTLNVKGTGDVQIIPEDGISFANPKNVRLIR